MKKAISFIVAVVMLMSSFGTSFAADPTRTAVQQKFMILMAIGHQMLSTNGQHRVSLTDMTDFLDLMIL